MLFQKFSVVKKVELTAALSAILLFLVPSLGKTEEVEKGKMTTFDLEKIVVTTSRIEQLYKNSPVNISIIDEDHIKNSGATTVTQILDALPSVEILDYGSYGSTKSVHTRGASSSQVLTLINGRPVNTPRDGVTDFNQIPLNNIERIEVLRGPASSIYGANAVGGVINIITKSGEGDMHTEFVSKYGTYSTRLTDLSHGWKVGDFDYFISGGWIKSRGHRANSDYEAYNLNSKIGYDINGENRVTFESGYYESEVGTPYKIVYEDLDDRQEAWKDYFDLTWNGSIWEDSQILLKLYHNLDRLEFIESLTPLDKYAHQTKIYGTDLQLSQTWFDIFRSAFGISGQEHKLNSSTSAKHEYNLKAAYVETEFDPFKNLVIKAGARIDDYSNFGDRISPSTSFSWWLHEMVKLHGLFAKSFRTPTFNDLYWPREEYVWNGEIIGGSEGNPNLGPEKATSYEIGTGIFCLDSIEADVTYFYTEFDALISWTVDSADWWRPENIDQAVIEGLEADFDWYLTKDLKLNFNYTYLEAKDEKTDKWLIYRPRNQYKGKINYHWSDRLGLYFMGRYITKRFTNKDNTRFLKEYFVADGNISYRINNFTEFLLTVTNIFDRDYEEEEDYTMPGRAYLVGGKIKF